MVAQAHIDELDAKREDLHAMKATLEHLMHCCHGDDRPDCPIVDNLAREGALPAGASHPAHGRTAGLQPGRSRRRAARSQRASSTVRLTGALPLFVHIQQ